MGDIGRTKIDEFERIVVSSFKHETEELLVRFSLGHSWLAIEAFIEEDFVWWQVTETSVAQNQTVVDIADVSNEQVVILEGWT